MSRLVQRIGIDRLVALLGACAFALLAVDVAVEHFADGVMEHRAQAPSVILPLVSMLILGGAAVSKLQRTTYRRAVRTAAALSTFTGVVGAWLHLTAILGEWGDEKTWSALLDALAVSPPLFAPFAFVGVGVLLWCIVAEGVRIFVDAPSADRLARKAS